MVMYWPTPDFKGRTFKLCVLKRWDCNYCVRSSLMWGPRGGLKTVYLTKNRFLGRGWIIHLQVLKMCTKHNDDKVNKAVSGFSWIRSYFWKSLSEWKSEINGANVKGEAVQDCGASEGEGPFSESLSACGWHTKSEAVRRWAKLTRGCVCGATATYYTAHTKTMLPTRKSEPRSSGQLDHMKISWW